MAGRTPDTGLSSARQLGQAASRPGRPFLWAAVGLAGLVVAWWWGSTMLGPIAMPSPAETARALIAMMADGRALPALAETGLRVLAAFTGAMLLGGALGLAAGLLPPLRQAVGPLVTMFLAVPPIAWVVLALLWFGTGGSAVVFTTLVALVPIPFVAAVQGLRTVDPGLLEMAAAYKLSLSRRLRDIILPHLLSYLRTAAVTAFGLGWKVTVMAELLAARDGIGSGLADSRANLATAETFAWIAIVVAAFLAIEAFVLQPLFRRLEPWRDRKHHPTTAERA